MFYIINRITGEVMQARGFWALGEDGKLYDVQDGWGCEGGGGSDLAPEHAVIVFGIQPEEVVPKPVTKPVKNYNFKCSCGQRFAEYSSALSHSAQTKQAGPHKIEEI